MKAKALIVTGLVLFVYSLLPLNTHFTIPYGSEIGLLLLLLGISAYVVNYLEKTGKYQNSQPGERIFKKTLHFAGAFICLAILFYFLIVIAVSSSFKNFF